MMLHQTSSLRALLLLLLTRMIGCHAYPFEYDFSVVMDNQSPRALQTSGGNLPDLGPPTQNCDTLGGTQFFCDIYQRVGYTTDYMDLNVSITCFFDATTGFDFRRATGCTCETLLTPSDPNRLPKTCPCMVCPIDFGSSSVSIDCSYLIPNATNATNMTMSEVPSMVPTSTPGGSVAEPPTAAIPIPPSLPTTVPAQATPQRRRQLQQQSIAPTPNNGNGNGNGGGNGGGNTKTDAPTPAVAKTDAPSRATGGGGGGGGGGATSQPSRSTGNGNGGGNGGGSGGGATTGAPASAGAGATTPTGAPVATTTSIPTGSPTGTGGTTTSAPTMMMNMTNMTELPDPYIFETCVSVDCFGNCNGTCSLGCDDPTASTKCSFCAGAEGQPTPSPTGGGSGNNNLPTIGTSGGDVSVTTMYGWTLLVASIVWVVSAGTSSW